MRAQPEPIPTIAVIEEAQSVIGGSGSGEGVAEGELDVDGLYRQAAIESLRDDEEVKGWIDRGGMIPWRGVQEALKRGVPQGGVPDLDRWAYELVPTALTELYGPQDEGWHTERRPKKDDPARTVLWVVVDAR